MLEGTLGAYAAFAAGPACQRLTVGTWTHSPWARRVAARDCGPAAVTTADAETVAFFDHVLKGRDLAGPDLRLFDVGIKAWCGFDDWPEPERTRLWLASNGLAATASSGLLASDPGRDAGDVLVHEPWRPAPALGGAWGSPPGYLDRAALDDRSDVAGYTGAPLRETCRLAGRVTATIYVDAPTLDLHATLSVVEPDGCAITLTEGHLRVAATAAPGARLVSMRAVCATLQPGQALRLSIQAAAWPAFAVNPARGSARRTPRRARRRSSR